MYQQKKAIFFDFGGTLMDYESDMRAHMEIMRTFRDRYGVADSVEELTTQLNRFIRSLNRNPVDADMMLGREIIRLSFGQMLDSLNLTFHKEDLEWFRQQYWEKHRLHITLYPEAKDVLRSMWETGLHVGLISDIDHDFMLDQLTRLGIIEFFDSLTSSEEAGVWKPNPRIFELALSKAECTGSEAIHIGDNFERDIQGGKNMGMATVWFPNDSDASSDVPDYTIQNLNEILTIVRDFGISLDASVKS